MYNNYAFQRNWENISFLGKRRIIENSLFYTLISHFNILRCYILDFEVSSQSAFFDQKTAQTPIFAPVLVLVYLVYTPYIPRIYPIYSVWLVRVMTLC